MTGGTFSRGETVNILTVDKVGVTDAVSGIIALAALRVARSAQRAWNDSGVT